MRGENILGMRGLYIAWDNSPVVEKLAVSEALLYRRGNFTGTFDQVILDALMAVKGAEIAFTPGFRWGTTILPGQSVLEETHANRHGDTPAYLNNALQ